MSESWLIPASVNDVRTRPVVFLDIDGVLATTTSMRKRNAGTIMATAASGMVLVRECMSDLADPEVRDAINRRSEPEPVPMYGFDDRAVACLNAVVVVTNAVIVVSSSWRIGFEFDSLRTFLARQGVTGEVVGRTDSAGPRRGAEIVRFVEMHGVVDYVALDDDDDLDDVGHRLVRTTPEVGLTPLDAQRAIDILRGRK